MRVSIQIACSLMVLSLVLNPVRAIGGICAQIVHGNFYDLGSLKSETGYSLDIANMHGKILFNMCQFLSFRCPGYNDSIAVYRSDDACIPLTLDSLTSGYNASILEKENQTDKEAGMNLSFQGVIPVDLSLGNESSKYNLQMMLNCDPNITEGYVWDDPLPTYDATNGTFTIYGKGATSCPKVSGSFIVEFFDKFSYLTAVIAIVIGAIQCFYGYRLYRPTVFLLGFLLAFMVIVLFLFAIWTGPESPSYKGYVIVAFAVLIGILFGFLVAAVAWVAIVVSGAVLGFFLSTFLYTLVLYKITSKPDNLLFFNTLAVGMVAGMIAGYEFQSAILILSCAFTGAYLLVRGVSVFLGGFPSELDLAATSQAGLEGSRLAYYGYLIAVIVLTLLGIVAQRRLHMSDINSDNSNRLLRSLLHRDQVEVLDLPPDAKLFEMTDAADNAVLKAKEVEVKQQVEIAEIEKEQVVKKATQEEKVKEEVKPVKKFEVSDSDEGDEEQAGSEEVLAKEVKKETKVEVKKEVKPELKPAITSISTPKKKAIVIEEPQGSSEEDEEEPKKPPALTKVEKVVETRVTKVVPKEPKKANKPLPQESSDNEEAMEEQQAEESVEETPPPPPKKVVKGKKKTEEVKVKQVEPKIEKKVTKTEDEVIEWTAPVEEPPAKLKKTNSDLKTTEDSDNMAANPIKKKIKKTPVKTPTAKDEEGNFKKTKRVVKKEEESSEIPQKKEKPKKKVIKKVSSEEED